MVCEGSVSQAAPNTETQTEEHRANTPQAQSRPESAPPPHPQPTPRSGRPWMWGPEPPQSPQPPAKPGPRAAPRGPGWLFLRERPGRGRERTVCSWVGAGGWQPPGWRLPRSRAKLT